MLHHLRQADVDTIIAACEAMHSETDPAESERRFRERDRIYSMIDNLPREAQD